MEQNVQHQYIPNLHTWNVTNRSEKLPNSVILFYNFTAQTNESILFVSQKLKLLSCDVNPFSMVD